MYRDETKNLIAMGDFCEKNRVPIYTMELFSLSSSDYNIVIHVTDSIYPSTNKMRFNSMAVVTNETGNRGTFEIVNDTNFKINVMMYYSSEQSWSYKAITMTTLLQHIGSGESVFMIIIASVS